MTTCLSIKNWSIHYLNVELSADDPPCERLPRPVTRNCPNPCENAVVQINITQLVMNQIHVLATAGGKYMVESQKNEK